jgi:hypothetical protein
MNCSCSCRKVILELSHHVLEVMLWGHLPENLEFMCENAKKFIYHLWFRCSVMLLSIKCIQILWHLDVEDYEFY